MNSEKPAHRIPMLALAMLTLVGIGGLAYWLIPTEIHCRMGMGPSPSPTEFLQKHHETLEELNRFAKEMDWFCLPIGAKGRFEGVFHSVFEGAETLEIFESGTMRFVGRKYSTGEPGQLLYDAGSLNDLLPAEDRMADGGGMLRNYHVKLTGWLYRQPMGLVDGQELSSDMIFVDRVESVRLFKAADCQKADECRQSAKKLGFVWYYL